MLKDKALDMLTRAGAFSPVRSINRSRVPILMYHRFSSGEEFGKTSQTTFEAHLLYLQKHYTLISLDDLVRQKRDGSRLPERSAVITIDDGYRDFYDIAFPILKRFGIPATIFVVTSFVDKTNWIWTDKARFILQNTTLDRSDVTVNSKLIQMQRNGTNERLTTAGEINSELKKLPDAEKDAALADLSASLKVAVPEIPPAEFNAFGWDEACEMQDNGVTIGSHTANHPILTNVDIAALDQELRVSKDVLEYHLQRPAVHFCYPNGNVSKRERDAAEIACYASAVTTELRLCENKDDLFLLPRIDAEPEMHRFVQATSGFDRLKSRVRALNGSVLI